MKFPSPQPTPTRDAREAFLTERLAAARLGALSSRAHSSDLLTVAREARLLGLDAVSCQAVLEEAERVFQTGQFQRGQLLCTSALNQARKAKLDDWRAAALNVKAAGLALNGQHKMAFKVYMDLLNDPMLCAALSPSQHAGLYLSLADLCGQVDPDRATLACIDLAFATLRDRGLEATAEFWLAQANRLTDLFAWAHTGFVGMLPAVQLPEQRRAALLQQADGALTKSLASVDRCDRPLARQRVHLHGQEIAALRTGSTKPLEAALAYLQQERVQDRRFQLTVRGALARAALVLDSPGMARSILHPVLQDTSGRVLPQADERPLLLLQVAVARGLGEPKVAHDLYIRYVRSWATQATAMLLDVQEIMAALESLRDHTPAEQSAVQPGYLQRAIEAWTTAEGRHLSVAALAARLRISERTLRAAFQSFHGTSPKQFIIMHRLQMAHDLAMRERTASLSEIAEQTGFSNPSRFANAFKARFGYSVSQLRRQSESL